MVRKIVPFDVYVGQEVFLQPTGNASRWWNGVLKVGEVVAVKRKYFYVNLKESKGVAPVKFSLESFYGALDDLNSGYLAYPSQEAFEEARKADGLIAEIRKALDYGHGRFDNISASAVEEIYNILVTEGVILKGGK